MTETANQLLSRVVPDCAWIPPRQRASSIPAYPFFPEVVRQWRFFSGSVNRYINTANNIPGGQFPVFATETVSLSVEDAKYRLHYNVLVPVNALLGTQGAVFRVTCTGLLGTPDFVICTNNSTIAKMPVEMKTRHNLNLRDHDLWEIYRHADRAPIMETDPNFRFKKKILSQVFGEMACNGLHYGILSNYTDTYFLQRLETEPKNLYVSHVVHPNSANPTLRNISLLLMIKSVEDWVVYWKILIHPMMIALMMTMLMILITALTMIMLLLTMMILTMMILLTMIIVQRGRVPLCRSVAGRE